jgi:hypothetical protein
MSNSQISSSHLTLRVDWVGALQRPRAGSRQPWIEIIACAATRDEDHCAIGAQEEVHRFCVAANRLSLVRPGNVISIPRNEWFVRYRDFAYVRYPSLGQPQEVIDLRVANKRIVPADSRDESGEYFVPSKIYSTVRPRESMLFVATDERRRRRLIIQCSEVLLECFALRRHDIAKVLQPSNAIHNPAEAAHVALDAAGSEKSSRRDSANTSALRSPVKKNVDPTIGELRAISKRAIASQINAGQAVIAAQPPIMGLAMVTGTAIKFRQGKYRVCFCVQCDSIDRVAP